MPEDLERVHSLWRRQAQLSHQSDIIAAANMRKYYKLAFGLNKSGATKNFINFFYDGLNKPSEKELNDLLIKNYAFVLKKTGNLSLEGISCALLEITEKEYLSEDNAPN